MQKIKPNLFLLLVLTPFCLVGDFILARYYPFLTEKLYQAHWLLLLGVLLLSLTPLGRKRLVAHQAEKPRFKWISYLSLLWIFELSLIAIFAGMSTLPQLLQPELTAPLSPLNLNWILSWGLFPWGAIALLASAFAYGAYVKQQDAFMSSLLYPLFKSSPRQSFGITANMCARLNTISALAGAFMLASASLAWLITHFLGFRLLQGLSVECLLVVSLILIIMGHHTLAPRLFDHLIKQNISAASIFVVAIALVTILLVLGSFLTKDAGLHSASLPVWLVKGASVEDLFKLFLALWAFSWTVISGVFIAYISRGYKIYQVILAVLILPLLGSLFVKHISWDSPIFILILSLLGVGVLLYLLMHRKHTMPLLMQVYVAGNDDIKHRVYRTYVINLIRIGVGLLYLYIPGGILLLGILSVMFTWPNLIYLLLALVAGGFVFRGL